ncbi:N-glycosyltransferase [Roseovarius sp. THAF9]|uniref:glycosyltransferase n=1 Tax=Roseovarius sp. THAF9 TaxID=2587847 RepID=UPI0012A8B438|nr:glycosyltransferase family 2 protein [Roseovarius sp. THAF9]QFT93841.1 N-glycosyltransferase [Roseovarius sp. THAF9]
MGRFHDASTSVAVKLRKLELTHLTMSEFLLLSFGVLTLSNAFALLEVLGARLAYLEGYTGKNGTTSEDLHESTSIVVCALFPNEESSLAVTVPHNMKLSTEFGMNYYLSVNANKEFDLSTARDHLQFEYKEDSLILNLDSDSKAENLNNAAESIDTKNFLILDADARIEYFHSRVKERISDDIACIQFTNRVLEYPSFLNWLVRHETDLKYFVSYPGRYRILETAYCSGSNALWRTEKAKQIGFSKSAATEDIEASIRSLLAGHRIVFSLDALAYDEAPPTWRDWWRQRRRWAIGWAQLFVRFQFSVLTSSQLTLIQKASWSVLLTVRRLLYPMAFAVLFLAGILDPLVDGTALVLLIIHAVGQSAICLVSCGLAWKILDSRGIDHNKLSMLGYVILFPLYDVVRTLSILASFDGFFRSKVPWHVTRRRLDIQ